MKYVNLRTKQETYILPDRTISGTLNPVIEQLQEDGWREITATESPATGWQVDEWGYTDIDGATCSKIIVKQSDIAANKAAADAFMAAQMVADKAARIAGMSADMWQQAAVFRATLRRNFPGLTPPAEINEAITAKAVQTYFIAKQMNGTITTQELADSMVLDRLFTALEVITGDGTTWTFPWGMLPE